jgi:hypothetical protein
MPKPDDEMSLFAAAAAACLGHGRRRQTPKRPPPVAKPPPFGSLDDAVAYLRPLLADATQPTRQRIRLLWTTAKQVRDRAGAAATFNALMALAVETRLINTYGWTGKDVRDGQHCFGVEDLAHVLKWAMRGMDPFDEGPEDTERADQ